jgi:hypothetical protein
VSEEAERYNGRVVTGASITLGHRSQSTLVSECTFQDCDITITCPAAGLILVDSTFRRCAIRVKKRFNNHQFFDTVFDGCQFFGRFSGCEFGFRDIRLSPRRGSITDCSFMNAELDFVSFNDTDMARVLLPPWPHFAILGPDAFANVPLFREEPTWKLLQRLGWRREQSALIFVYRVGGSYGYALSPDTAREALQSASGIRVDAAAV